MRKSYLIGVSFSLTASVLSKIAGGLSSFFIAKALQPANFGIWLTLTLFVSYCPILSLGTVETLLKQIPFYIGKGEFQTARRLEDVIFTAILLAAAAILSIGLIFMLFLKQLQASSIMPEIILMVVAASLSFPSAYFYYRFVARQNFKTMGIVEITRAFTNVSLIVGFSYIWGLMGAAAGFCITEMMICLVSWRMSRRSHGQVNFALDFRTMWNSILIGFPITIFWWIFMLQGSADRVVSISFLGKVPTGYYGIGISIVSVMFLLPKAISKVLYPRINEKLGETARVEDLFRIVILPTRILNLFLSGVIGIAVIFMPFVYHLVPKYLPGLAAGEILLVLSTIRLSTANGVNFLIATNKQKQLCLLGLGSLCIGVIAAYGAVWSGWGIEGLAVSTFVSDSFFALFMWRSVFEGMGFASSKQWREIVKLQVPFLVMLIILGFGILVAPQFLTHTTKFSIAYAVIFAIIYAAMIFITPMTRQWGTEVVTVLRGTLAPRSLEVFK